ncbi:MAG: recombinase family protein [Bacillota bacterium]|nr:recombinase family protein [Bacillota bacterium]
MRNGDFGMKAAVYCRLSEEDRDKSCAALESSSIQNQKSLLLEYAAEQGWEIYDVYSDDNRTGSDRNRPEFLRLLKDAEAGRFDIILCKTQSRFTREMELVEKYIHGLFPSWGIRFVGVVDNVDTADKGNKKSRQINGLINEWYLEDMSENIRSVLTNRRINGFHIGSFALYGYMKDPRRKGHLVVDEEAASVVREVFSLYSRGFGKTAIARILNERGIPNPTEYKRLKGLRYKQPGNRNSTLWKYSAISDMLKNEIYIGNMVQGKHGSISYKTKKNRSRPRSEWYIAEGTHEPIIDRELWDRVQILLARRSKPFSSGTVGIFSGKTRCLYCGSSLRSSKSRGRHYLQCSTHHVSAEACPGAFISTDKLEEIVKNELVLLSSKYLDIDRLEHEIKLPEACPGDGEFLKAVISSQLNKASECTEAIRELYIDKTKGLISDRDYYEIYEHLCSERLRLEQAVSEAGKQLNSARTGHVIQSEDTEKETEALSPRDTVEKYLTFDPLTRDAVETLIDFISVGKRIAGTRDVPLEIHWKF